MKTFLSPVMCNSFINLNVHSASLKSPSAGSPASLSATVISVEDFNSVTENEDLESLLTSSQLSSMCSEVVFRKDSSLSTETASLGSILNAAVNEPVGLPRSKTRRQILNR